MRATTFDPLTLLVESYDDKHYDSATPAERLKSLMSSAGVTPTELAQILGVGKSAVSMLLSGKRQLSKQSIVRLSRRFRVEAGYFL